MKTLADIIENPAKIGIRANESGEFYHQMIGPTKYTGEYRTYQYLVENKETPTYDFLLKQMKRRDHTFNVFLPIAIPVGQVKGQLTGIRKR